MSHPQCESCRQCSAANQQIQPLNRTARMGFLPRHSERPFLFTASGAASFHGSIKPQKKNDPAAESLTKNLRFLSGASQHTFRVAPLPAHLGKHGQCHPVQHIVHRVIHLFPQPARGALIRPRAFRRVLCKSRYRSKVALLQPEDLPRCVFLGGIGQSVTALCAAHAAHKARFYKL